MPGNLTEKKDFTKKKKKGEEEEKVYCEIFDPNLPILWIENYRVRNYPRYNSDVAIR